MKKPKDMRRAEAEYRQLRSNTRELLKTKQGKDFIWHVLSLCGIYSDTFTGNSQTYFLEGKRSIGLEILQLIEDVDPTAYARLLLDKQKQKQNKQEI